MSDPFADPFADPFSDPFSSAPRAHAQQPPAAREPGSGPDAGPGDSRKRGREGEPDHTWRRGERPEEVLLPEDLGFTGFLDRKEKHNKAIEAAKVARLTAAEGFGANAIPLGPQKGFAPAAAPAPAPQPPAAATAVKHYADEPTTPPEPGDETNNAKDDDENWRERAYSRGRSRSRSTTPDPVPEPTFYGRGGGRGRGQWRGRGRAAPAAGYMQRGGIVAQPAAQPVANPLMAAMMGFAGAAAYGATSFGPRPAAPATVPQRPLPPAQTAHPTLPAGTYGGRPMPPGYPPAPGGY